MRSVDREISMQILYSLEQKRRVNKSEELNSVFLAEKGVSELLEDFHQEKKYDEAFIERMITGIVAEQKNIDTKINGFSKGWKVQRMAPIDLSILRLGVYEIEYCEDIPKPVSINEAVELSKKFSTEDSQSFINAILDQFN